MDLQEQNKIVMALLNLQLHHNSQLTSIDAKRKNFVAEAQKIQAAANQLLEVAVLYPQSKSLRIPEFSNFEEAMAALMVQLLETTNNLDIRFASSVCALTKYKK